MEAALNIHASPSISTFAVSREMNLQESTISNNRIPAETELIDAAKKDAEKFEPLYKQYHEAILRFVYQRLDDKETAFDITHQVFLKALTNIKKYEHRGLPFSSWLYRIAFNELNMLFRERKAQRTMNIRSAHVNEIAEEIEENNSDNYEKMLQLLPSLPEDELYMIEMRFFEKRSFKEIAEILETNEANAKMKLYRILERIKKNLTTK